MTVNPLNHRLSCHISESRRKTTDGKWHANYYKSRKIRELLEKNEEIAIEEVASSESMEEISQLEIQYIKEFKEKGIKITNIKPGGQTGAPNRKCPQELKDYYSKIYSGSGNPNYGNHVLKGKPSKAWQDPEKKKVWCKKIKENHADVSGNKNPMYGMSGALAPKSKTVEQWCHETGNLVAIYGSFREAVRVSGVSEYKISKSLKNKNLPVNDFIFKYKTS